MDIYIPTSRIGTSKPERDIRLCVETGNITEIVPPLTLRELHPIWKLSLPEQLKRYKALFVHSEAFGDLIRVYYLKSICGVPERFWKMLGCIGAAGDVPWESLLTTRDFQDFLDSYLRSLITTFKNTNIDYYLNTYSETLFDNKVNQPTWLQPIKIDTEAFNTLMNDPEEGSKAPLGTFRPPMEGGFTYPVCYSKSETLTGRLKVVDGPDVLHIKKEHRNKIIVSRFGTEGSIVYLDYKSLEPRVLLAINNKTDIPADIYTHLAKEVGIPSTIPRETIKTSVISLLYGASREALCYKLRSPEVENPEDLVDSVEDYFDLHALRERLATEYQQNNQEKIYNFYGRPIWCKGTSPSTLVNYYVQSTAVDVALYGFRQILNRISDADALAKFVPLFVLHDALCLDVHNSVLHLVPKVMKAGLKIPGLEETKFYLEEQRVASAL